MWDVWFIFADNESKFSGIYNFYCEIFKAEASKNRIFSVVKFGKYIYI